MEKYSKTVLIISALLAVGIIGMLSAGMGPSAGPLVKDLKVGTGA